MKRRYSITIALSISLFIYVFFRSEKTLVNELIVYVFSFPAYMSVKSAIVNRMPLPDTIIFSLPGGLWMFCVTAVSQGFYIKIKQYEVNVWMLPIQFALGLELCQLAELTNGRFDIWDIVFYLLFWLLAYGVYRSNSSKQNIAAPFTLHGFLCLACFLSVYLAHVNQ
ncbi:MAG TPA: hypothetical protein VGD40_06330 [Chryseosolibacter sp.]